MPQTNATKNLILGLMLDENMTWKDHIYMQQKKIAKTLYLLYRAKQLLIEESIKIIYFSYIQSYFKLC